MELPNISIPKALLESIPMDQIPTLAHPPLIHFAIVLPIVIVLLELVNIIVKSGATPEEPKGRGVSTLSFLLIIAMVVIFTLAYITGSVDGKAAWDTLGEAGQSALKEHKLLGTYLVFGSIVLLVFKFIALIGGAKGRVLLLLLAIVFAAATLKQGKEGGELVYQHGANVEAFKDCDSDKFDLNDEIDSLKEQIANKATDVQPTPEAKEKVEASNEVAETPKVAEVQVEQESVAQQVMSKAEKAIETVKDIVTTPEPEKTASEEKVAQAMEDTVSTQESQSIESPKPVAGEEVAQAHVEEAQAIENVEAQNAATNFQEESREDTTKVVEARE